MAMSKDTEGSRRIISAESDARVYESKDRNFNNCPFKLMLPDISELDDIIHLNFHLKTKMGIKVIIALSEIIISDKLNHVFNSIYSDKIKEEGVHNKTFYLEIPTENKRFLVPSSNLIMRFLSNDHRLYEVAYTFSKEKEARLEYVMIRDQGEKETSWLEKCVKGPDTIIDIKGEEGKKTNGNMNVGSLLHNNPIIEKYRKALLREKNYLQNEGGRKHRLSNGRQIHSRIGLYVYAFEIEAELSLSDDAPVKLYVGQDVANGQVLICEGFEIIVVVDKDFGKRITQALLGVEPWILLEALAKQLESITTEDQIVFKLINEGPEVITKNKSMSIPKGQFQAIEAARNRDITLIWGPPGTGKTYTMAQIAKEGLQKGKKILIVSHSNVSVDGVIKQTVASLRNSGMENLITTGKVLRYGFVRDENLSKDSNVVAYNYVMSRRPDLKQKSTLLEMRKALQSIPDTEKYDMVKKLRAIRREVREEEQVYVKAAQLVATTISKVTIDPLFEKVKYDIVMFDEVSMAYVPQVICAATHAREKLILVGDFCQLAPIVQSEAKDILGKDIFGYLGISNTMNVYPHPWLVMLNEQRRMHPDISEFSNQNIYGNLLTNHESVLSNRREIVEKKPLPGRAIGIIDTAGTYCACMKNSENSRFNILSAIISFLMALQAEESLENSIGIITPYAAQTRLIRAMIQDYCNEKNTEVTCATVHQFQGSERNIIIFDAVESYPSSKVGWLMSKDMDSVNRLINVAITRAKGKFITVANETFWKNRFGDTHHIFYRLLNYLRKSGQNVSANNKSLNPFIQQLPDTKNIKLYISSSEAVKRFREDIRNVKNQIVISIPDGKLDTETQEKIFRLIEELKDKKIRVLCKTNDYEALPARWKNIAWASENAIFPLIMLDDFAIWYGIPKSQGKFMDGNTGYLTVCPTIYRIQGEHTLEIIKTFSDLEYRVVNGQKKPLLPKDKMDAKSGDEPTGLDLFVREKVRCPKCQKPMMVVRSMRGKVYLKCTSSSCKEMAYLTPEITNWYIDSRHVTCPVHHCDIYAKLGQYGIYVQCEQGHYLKPDEI